MKRNTRQEIMDTAKKLFGERGYNAVSVGEIAKALGISKGNLTYYFKKKEEIMEAILDEATPVFPEKAPETVEEWDGFFLHTQQVREENAFYFWNHAQLSALSPKIREKQVGVYQHNYMLLTQGLELLEAKGMIRPEGFHGEYAQIADDLLLLSIYLLPFNALKQGTTGESVDYRVRAWGRLYPLLTNEGVKAIERLHVFS